MTRSLTEAVARALCPIGEEDEMVLARTGSMDRVPMWRLFEQDAGAIVGNINRAGFAIVPNARNMTDEQAEAICELAPVCGGMAHSIYHAALKAAGHDDYARPGAGE